MGNKIKKYIIFFLCLLSSFVVLIDTMANNIEENIVIAGYNLKLIQTDKKCELHFKHEKITGKILLNLKPPCRFIRHNNKVLYYAYNDVNVLATLIVVGAPIYDDCGTEIQGIIVKDEGVFVTNVDKHVVICAEQGADQKMFWTFAHEDILHKSDFK